MTRRLVDLHRAKGKLLFFSKKQDCDVHPETFMERNYALRLEYADDVKSYACQPETGHTNLGERSPDFLVKYNDNTFAYVETHKEKDVDDEYREQIEKYNRYFLETSERPFKLVLDTSMCQIETHNLSFLYDYRHIDWPHVLPSNPSFVTYSQLVQLCEKELDLSLTESKITALCLIADKQYLFDLSELLTRDTQLRRKNV